MESSVPTYTVKIKGKAHEFTSDLADDDAIIRLRKLVKKGLVKGPFATDLLKQALSGEITMGWLPYVHFFAVSKKARQEFGSDKSTSDRRTQSPIDRNAIRTKAGDLVAMFGYQGATQALRDAIGTFGGPKRALWTALLGELATMADPERPAKRKREVLIED